jgi:hypothetical protein
MGYEPELGARRLSGRWDPVHLGASRRRSPGERLELAVSANHLAGRLRQAGAEGRPVDLEDVAALTEPDAQRQPES